MKNLQRSNQLNGTVKYWSDATGRDSYIVNNNGGFFVKTPSKQAHQTFTFNKQQRNKTDRNHNVEKLVHYVSDGTGKDTYIKCNDGGQFQSNKDNDIKNYYKSLRGYSQSQNWVSNKPDYFQQCQNSMSQKEFHKNKIISNVQKSLINKLSVPKLK